MEELEQARQRLWTRLLPHSSHAFCRDATREVRKNRSAILFWPATELLSACGWLRGVISRRR